ncbi:4-amino-4-deoxy-L-arabinose-phosphoundecaprenol flippase subunit ArnE [Erwinia sp. V71]|uniref:4-amino-4-deoxy-L-arabinose-phosphoundecaprenol flippase subunit ArnE n=1 Tax=Erwinia sp. V71 TaxID=3369424 RepID=UPI003F6359C4
MNMLLIVIASLLSCASQLCQKQATRHGGARWRAGYLLLWLAASLLLLGGAMLVWLLVLQQTPVSVAYPMLSMNFILVTLAARWLWQERITLRHSMGILLIIAGIVTLGVSA